MGRPNDTTTTLNLGTGGDVMDESSVTNYDGTAVKRPRVVPGSDDGDIQTFSVRGDDVAAVVEDRTVGDLLREILAVQEKQLAVLRLLRVELTGAIESTDDELVEWIR